MILTYARKFRVDTKWLLEGSGAMTPSDDQRQFFDVTDRMEKRAGNRQKIQLGRAGDVPQFNIHAGMGAGGALSVMVGDDGLAIDPEDSDGFWSFPDSVKAGMRNLRKVYAMQVTGDSMEPTLPGGSYAFVDISHNVPSPEDIYALDYGDGLMVKRVQLIPKSDKLMVISDNDHYQDYELLREDVRVYGRVVAWFQWRG
ncbi:MAG: hypothetical protein Kow0026_08460 [Oricola sp.]